MGRFELRRALWWQEEDLDRFVAGVFEGGGAKGILYRGALEAMEERRCWFAAVAGASAGAITSTLIAAGFRPEQVAAQTSEGLEALRAPRLVNGLLRVRDGVSYLDQDSLFDWLGGLLEGQIFELTGTAGGAEVTFEELAALTRMELDVVAVDLERKRPVVFNHALTPRCQVAAAVVASAAIPLAFEWQPLAVPNSAWGVIVDGGVISSFPRFVFSDASFRRWAGLEPLPAEIPVVGFLLDEQPDPEEVGADVYREAVLLPPVSRWPSLKAFLAGKGAGVPDGPSESKRRTFRPRRAGRTRAGPALRRVARPLVWPLRAAARLLLVWVPEFLRWNGGGARAAWPTPRSRPMAALVGWFDAVMSGTRPPFVFLGGFAAATLCLGVGAYHVAWLPLVHQFESSIEGRTSIPGSVIGISALLLWSLVPIYAWLLLTLVFGGGWILHRTVQDTAYGLLRTFLQNPGAPPWAGEAPGDAVVRIRVPEGLTTLADGLGEGEREAALEEAREATRAVLRGLETAEPVRG